MCRWSSENGKPDVRVRVCHFTHLIWVMKLRLKFNAACHLETYFQVAPLCRTVPRSMKELKEVFRLMN